MHLFTLLALALILGTVTCEPITVTTSLGAIVGESISSPHPEANRPVHRFLGIPYAQPPVGALRFHRPRPLETKWSTPIEATTYPSQCVQGDVAKSIPTHAQFLKNTNYTEDCLYLNIWSPNAQVESEEELKPVLVWIHGGALTVGTASFDLYDSEVLAAKADAVIVTINYRVSTLGFLYSDAVPEIAGNQGLWDQAAALEWVAENIRYFGGDPRRVTIMGQSAGGWSVSLHVLSPVSRNLFHSAMLMSGAAMDTTISKEEFVELYLTGIRKVGCATKEDTSISQGVIECLQGLPSEKVETIYNLIDKKNPAALVPLVVIDGTFLTATPRQMLAEGNYKTNVNLLVSTVEDEGSFIMALSGIPQFAATNPTALSLSEAKTFLSMMTGSSMKSTEYQEALAKIYFNGLNENLDIGDSLRKQVGIGYGDHLLGCPTLEFAKAVYRKNPNTATVYQWLYSAKLGNLKYLCNPWAGTCHCDELYPAFGMAFRYPDEYLTRERELANEVMNLIKSFLWNGKPTAEQPEWTPYFLTDDGKTVIAPYYEIGNSYKKAESFKFNLKQVECSVFAN